MKDKFLELLLYLGVFPAMVILALLEKVYIEKISGAVMTTVSMVLGGFILTGLLFGILTLVL